MGGGRGAGTPMVAATATSSMAVAEAVRRDRPDAMRPMLILGAEKRIHLLENKKDITPHFLYTKILVPDI